MSARPGFAAPFLARARGSGWLSRAAFRVLRWLGWKVAFAEPLPPRCVVVFYPHTSNWDFVVGLLAKWAIDVRFRWVAKDSLFATPAGPLFRRWGGIPVDRRRRTGFIAQMARLFETSGELALVIAPEGTRRRTAHWKSGFWHLARAARVPVALAFIDYGRREVGIGGYLVLTGRRGHDIAAIAAFYEGRRGRRPEHATPVRLGPDERD